MGCWCYGKSKELLGHTDRDNEVPDMTQLFGSRWPLTSRKAPGGMWGYRAWKHSLAVAATFPLKGKEHIVNQVNFLAQALDEQRLLKALHDNCTHSIAS